MTTSMWKPFLRTFLLQSRLQTEYRGNGKCEAGVDCTGFMFCFDELPAWRCCMLKRNKALRK